MKKFLSLLLVLSMVLSLTMSAFAAPIPEKPYVNSNFFSYKDYTLHYRVYDGPTSLLPSEPMCKMLPSLVIMGP